MISLLPQKDLLPVLIGTHFDRISVYNEPNASAMTMEELNREQLTLLKEKLLQAQCELRELLQNNQAAAATVDLDQSRIGRVSRIDAMQQQEMAKAEITNTENRLKYVALALNKIDRDDDSYAYCTDCDENIPLARLLIKPESQYCIRCQQKRESN